MSDPRFEALVETIEPGGRLLAVRDLTGGVSAHVTAIEVEDAAGRRETLVVRRHGVADLARNPRIAEDELTLLRTLERAGVPAPRPRYAESSARFFSTPCLVVEYVEGEVEREPADVHAFTEELAAVLAQIHRVPTDALSFLYELEPPESASGRNRPALVHGDFWPGNVLWKQGRLQAVIDWEDAALGDPLADVANARLELRWALGPGATAHFTRRYESLAPDVDLSALPHWDLWAARRLGDHISEWSLEPDAERALRRERDAFVAEALERLKAST